MLNLTWSITCDHCGKTARFGSEHVQGTDSPSALPSRPTVFGADVCDECLRVAKQAIQSALQPRGPAERLPS